MFFQILFPASKPRNSPRFFTKLRLIVILYELRYGRRCVRKIKKIHPHTYGFFIGINDLSCDNYQPQSSSRRGPLWSAASFVFLSVLRGIQSFASSVGTASASEHPNRISFPFLRPSRRSCGISINDKFCFAGIRCLAFPKTEVELWRRANGTSVQAHWN